MINTVLFDLDGTLVNSIEDLAASANYALSFLGYAMHETEKYRYFVGDGMLKLIERILPPKNRDTQTIKECHRIFRSHYDEHYLDKTREYDGIMDLLQGLKLKGYKIGVISNKTQECATAVVNGIFGEVFDVVCGKREGYPVKPDPTLTLDIIKELGVNGNECAFVGDSGMDMLTATRVNALPIGVLWGFREGKELLENGAVHLIEKPAHLLDILEEENAKL